VEGARIAAKVLNHSKGDKVLVFKKKRRKGYQKMNGHRQYLTELWIEAILGKGEKFDASKSTAPAPKAQKVQRSRKRRRPQRRELHPSQVAAKKAAPAKKAALRRRLLPRRRLRKRTTSNTGSYPRDPGQARHPQYPRSHGTQER
jgi:large subunit ribosomal protein L21